MPRLDAERLQLWRTLTTTVARMERAVEVALWEEYQLSPEVFEILSALQRANRPMRVKEVTDETAGIHSTVVRRLDKMVDLGWVDRQRDTDIIDARSVWLSLTKEGRDVWRDANVTYRRAVQATFASHLGDAEVESLTTLLGVFAVAESDADTDTDA